MMTEILNLEKKRIIDEIVFKINNKDLDISAVCERIYMTPNEFIDIIQYPNKKLSIYLEILEVVNQL